VEAAVAEPAASRRPAAAGALCLYVSVCSKKVLDSRPGDHLPRTDVLTRYPFFLVFFWGLRDADAVCARASKIGFEGSTSA
jgi:hypothetical protein